MFILYRIFFNELSIEICYPAHGKEIFKIFFKKILLKGDKYMYAATMASFTVISDRYRYVIRILLAFSELIFKYLFFSIIFFSESLPGNIPEIYVVVKFRLLKITANT